MENFLHPFPFALVTYFQYHELQEDQVHKITIASKYINLLLQQQPVQSSDSCQKPRFLLLLHFAHFMGTHYGMLSKAEVLY